MKFIKNSIFQKYYWFFKSLFDKFQNLTVDLFNNSKVSQQWKKVDKTYESSKKLNDKPLNVLLAPFNGFAEAILGIESIVGKSLQLRGHNVSILSCNSSLPACQWNLNGNANPKFLESKIKKFSVNHLDVCKSCHNSLCKVSKSSEIEITSLSNFYDNNSIKIGEDFLKNKKLEYSDTIFYKGINISEHAYSTTIRVMLRGSLENDTYSKALYRRFLLSAIILVENLENLFNQKKIDRIFCVHGIYLEHGILCSVANKLGIPIIIYGTPYRKNTIWASNNDTYHREIMNEKNSEWNNFELNSNMNEKLNSYLFSKVSGGRDNVNYHPNPIIDKETIFKQLSLSQSKPIITLFTNVLWDAQIFYKSNAFNGLLDWIYFTIEKFIKKDDYQILIRIHPAESKGGFSTAQPLEKEIKNKFPILPEHIKIIPPESDISSYSLSEVSKANIIYGTNMGLEIAARGLPLVIAGECYSRGKGFSYDIDNKEQYLSLIEKGFELDDLIPPNQVELARKYAYYLNFKRCVDFKSFDTPVSGKNLSRKMRLNFDSISSLDKGNDRGLDILCNGIINLEKIIQ